MTEREQLVHLLNDARELLEIAGNLPAPTDQRGRQEHLLMLRAMWHTVAGLTAAVRGDSLAEQAHMAIVMALEDTAQVDPLIRDLLLARTAVH